MKHVIIAVFVAIAAHRQLIPNASTQTRSPSHTNSRIPVTIQQ